MELDIGYLKSQGATDEDIAEIQEQYNISAPEPIVTKPQTIGYEQAPMAPAPMVPGMEKQAPTVMQQVGDVAGEIGQMMIPPQQEQVYRAAARPIMGLAQISEDIANKFGASTNVVKSIMEENEEVIESYNQANPNAPINPSTIGDMAGNYIATLGTQAVKPLMAIEGFLEFLKSKGTGETYKEAGKAGITGAAVAGVGAKAFDMLFNKDVFKGLSKNIQKTLKTKNDAQLQEYLDMLKFAKDKDLKLFDAMINGDLSTIQSTNIFAKDQIANLANNFEVSELKAIGTILKTEAKSFEDIGNKFAKSSKDLRDKYRVEEGTLYDAAKSKSGKNRYNIKDLQTKVVDMLRGQGAEQSVINAVKRELFHLEKTMSPEETAVRKTYDQTKKRIKSLTSKLNKAKPHEKGRLTANINRVKNQRDALRTRVDSFMDINYLNTTQLMDTVKRINSDIFTKGGNNWGATDAAARKMAKDAKNAVEDFITDVNKDNPEFLKTYTKAKETSRERFGIFGSGDKGTKDFPELAKALHTKDTEQLARNIIQGQSKFKLKMIDEMLGSELSKDFTDKYVNNILDLTPRKGLRGDELFQVDMANTDKLGKNLSSLVDDKDNYDFLVKQYGAESASDLKSLSKLANGLAGDINAIRERTSELDKGLLHYVSEKGYLSGSLRVISDAVRYAGRSMIGRQPYQKTKEVKKVIKALEKHLGAKIPLKDKLTNVSQDSKLLSALGALSLDSKGEAKTYEVKAGDSLDKISQDTNTTVETLMEMNNLKDSTIQPGQELVVSAEASDISTKGSITEEMLMEASEMPESVKRSEMLGNEDLITKGHGKGNKTIGYGIDLAQEPDMGKHILERVGVDDLTIKKLLNGSKFAEITREQAEKASDMMYSYKYSQAKNLVPDFDKFGDEEQTLLVDLMYNGALKASGYTSKDKTRKKLWSFVEDKDLEGMMNYISTSSNPFAKRLANRLFNRAGYPNWAKYNREKKEAGEKYLTRNLFKEGVDIANKLY